jgi:hypothetical protein
VYLVNGVTNKIPFSSFDPPMQAGFTQFTYTTDDRLNGYPASKTLLGFGVICGSQKYMSAGGSIHAVSSSLLPEYPFTYVQLDDLHLRAAEEGLDATAFIRTPDGSTFYLDGEQKHPIGSMARFTELAAGKPYTTSCRSSPRPSRRGRRPDGRILAGAFPQWRTEGVLNSGRL